MYDYLKQTRWAGLKIGVLATFAMAIVFVSIMFAGNIMELFSPKVEIYTSFDDVKGLREGSLECRSKIKNVTTPAARVEGIINNADV